jgi:transgelin
MASVSSLDKDLRQMRLDKYTPRAASEVRLWIEEVLGERLPPGDLLDALKDGVALCRYGGLRLDRTMLNTLPQTYQPCSVPGRQIQAVRNALRPDGEHLPLPESLPDASTQPPSTRRLPHS